jgi:hypothetical protein
MCRTNVRKSQQTDRVVKLFLRDGAVCYAGSIISLFVHFFLVRRKTKGYFPYAINCPRLKNFHVQFIPQKLLLAPDAAEFFERFEKPFECDFNASVNADNFQVRRIIP